MSGAGALFLGAGVVLPFPPLALNLLTVIFSNQTIICSLVSASRHKFPDERR